MPESTDQTGFVLKEHDYIGLSEASSKMPSSDETKNKSSCTLEDTDLNLGLGLGLGLSSSSVKEASAKPAPAEAAGSKPEASKFAASFQDFLAPKNGSKRGYAEANAVADTRFHAETANRKVNEPEPKATAPQNASFLSTWTPAKPTVPAWHNVNLEKPAAGAASFGSKLQEASERVSTEDTPPPPKERVVGWPPVRSYRRQTLAKPAEMFVKVNMDGITVGRKVDLNAYTSYEGLLLALEEMFQPSNGAQGTSQAAPAREKHFLLSGSSDFVLTYEDKDGDWMLVGDVPWTMFISTVKRLRIARGSDANGPAPRAPESSRFHV